MTPQHLASLVLALVSAAPGCASSMASDRAAPEVVLAVAGPPAGEERPAPEPDPAADGAIGSRAPEIRGVHLSGKGPTTLREARGKVVLIHFWATFCDPCKRSLPAWQALRERFRDQVAVIAVSVDEAEAANAAAIAEFVAHTGARFPIVWDDRGETVRAFEPAMLPMTFVVDRTGRIRLADRGFVDGTAAIIEEKVAELVGESAPDE